MGGACNKYGRGEVHTEFWWGNPRERDNLEDAGVNGRIILRWIYGKWDRGMDWICLAQERDTWRTVVSVVIIFLVPLNAETFCIFVKLGIK